jgi:UPF0176 protein
MSHDPKYPANKFSREELVKRLESESFKRKTISFYRYVILDDPMSMRNQLFKLWSDLNCLGRIYLATEGVNAQMSVPEHNWEDFVTSLYSIEAFKDVPFKIAIEDDGKSFIKLLVKVRERIVADGLTNDDYDVTNVGRHLTAKEWNEAIKMEDAVVVDMRNFYESEIGHFKNALLPQSETFRDELPEVLEMLKGQENKKVLLYCTGGIRCEKTSSYLKHHGFNDVNQLHGGIIDYARQIKSEGLENTFLGKNFVFDDRLGERITSEVIARCHQCGAPCDTHANCANIKCNLLFIQCPDCAEQFEKCCSTDCMEGKDPQPFEGRRRIFHRTPEN